MSRGGRGDLGIGPGEARSQSGQVPAFTIDQFMETVRISTPSLSPDGETVLG